MIDRGKVIKALEICFTPTAKCKDCPYDELGAVPNCTNALGKDALALLKEQTNAYDYLQKQFFEVQDKLIEQQQIVRCKDCKFKEKSFVIDRQWWCNRLEKHCEDDWFCADGERVKK